MKIYVAACCVTYDTRGALGTIKNIKVFRNMEEAQKYIKDEIEYLKGCQRILDLEEYGYSNIFYANYIKLEGYDEATEQTYYSWRVEELENKEGMK